MGFIFDNIVVFVWFIGGYIVLWVVMNYLDLKYIVSIRWRKYGWYLINVNNNLMLLDEDGIIKNEFMILYDIEICYFIFFEFF